MIGYKLKISDLTYNSKKAAIEFYSINLNKYEPSCSVDDLDFSFLIDLFNYCPKLEYNKLKKE